MRAYLFLEALNNGLSTVKANAVADHIMTDPSSTSAQNAIRIAKADYKLFHGGKQLPLIGHAYRQGMSTTMPQWYRQMAMSTQQTYAMEVIYTMRRMQIAEEQQEAANSEGYQAFYETFSDEVYRLSGQQLDTLVFGENWEQATLIESYRDGDDPLYLAARFSDEHGVTKEAYNTFETYRDAVFQELRRYTPENALYEQRASALSDKPLRDAFASSMHPRRVAYGYHRSCARRAAAS